MSNNLLQSFPLVAQNLEIMNLGYNRIAFLPIQFNHLTNLKELHVQMNRFSLFPIAPNSMKNLQYLSLEWFQYVVPKMNTVVDSHIIQKLQSKLIKFQQQNKDQNYLKISEFIQLMSEKRERQRKLKVGTEEFPLLFYAMAKDHFSIFNFFSRKNPKLLT